MFLTAKMMDGWMMEIISNYCIYSTDKNKHMLLYLLTSVLLYYVVCLWRENILYQLSNLKIDNLVILFENEVFLWY